jgi:hypothetical protein
MAVTINGTSGLVFNDASTQSTAASGFGFKNRIINGAMMLDQRNAGASVSLVSAQTYNIDRWFTSEDTDGAMTIQQSTVAPTGFSHSALLTTTTADSSLGSTQNAYFGQKIEGFNTADLMWGTANAQTITLSFWVRSSLTGTFGGAITNSSFTRGYPFTYTISSANTWEQKSITVAGDTTGTWVGATNGAGIQLLWGLGAGSSLSGTAGAWAATGYISATGAVSVIGTLNATWYITGVQLEKGSTATSFDYRPYGTELQLCQRYFYADRAPATGIGLCAGVCFTSSGPLYVYRYPVIMRTSPTFTYSALSDFHVVYSGAVSTPTLLAASAGSVSSCRLDATSTVVSGQGSILQTATGNAVLNFSAEL